MAAGVGLLCVLRYPRDLPSVLFLAPVTITAFWLLAANIVLRTGHSMRQATPLLWGLTLVLAVTGMSFLWRRRQRWRSTWAARDWLVTWGLAGVTGALLVYSLFMLRPVRHVPDKQDACNYTLISALAWQYGGHLEQPRSPVEQQLTQQLGALIAFRNHAFVLMGFFSPLVEAGEPVTVRNVFVWWSFVVLASSLAFYEVSRRTMRAPLNRSWIVAIRIPLLLVVTMGFGWAVVPAFLGSWDNIVVAYMCPVLAGLALRTVPSPGYAALLGSLAAFGVYGYVELAPAMLVLSLPYFVWSVVRSDASRRTWAAYAGAAVIATLWLRPGLERIAYYLAFQWTHARGVVGRGIVLGLVDQASSTATWWALGPEHLLPVAGWTAFVAPVLSALAFAGVVRVARAGSYPELSALGLALASTSYLVLVDRYPYGVFKMLTASWWLWGTMLMEGICAVLSLSQRVRHVGARRGALLTAVLALLAIVAPGLQQVRHVRKTVFFPEEVYARQPTVGSLRRLRNAGRQQPPASVLLAGDESVRTGWISYALRSTAMTHFHIDRGLLVPGSRPWPPPADSQQLAGIMVPRRRAWMYAELPRRFETSDFALIPSSAGAFLEDVQSPNGVEDDGMWLGTRRAVLTIVADRPTRATLAVRAIAGPGRTSGPRMLLLRGVAGELGRATFERKGQARFDLDLARGLTYLALLTPDRPDEPAEAERSIRITAIAVEPAPPPE